jgi:predicted PurR-regulated permease PerM
MPDRRTVFLGALLFFTAGLLVAGVVYLFVRLNIILIWLVIAMILASGLSPIVRRLENPRPGGRGLGRVRSVLLVFAGLLLAAAVVGTMIGVPAARQITLFLRDSNEYLHQARVQWQQMQEQAAWLPDLTWVVDRMLAYVREQARPGAAVAQFGIDLLGKLGGTITVMVLTLYMLLQPPRVDRLVDWLVPEDRKRRLRVAFAQVARKFQQWLRAQFILSVTVGSMMFVGLLALGIPYPHLLALVSAVGELIPIAGPILAAIPAVGVALFQSPQQALGVATLAVVIQAFGSYVLVPKVMRDVVGVPPLVTITGLLVGFELFGILGAVLAVPMAAALGILLPEIAGALASPTPLSEPERPRPVRTEVP